MSIHVGIVNTWRGETKCGILCVAGIHTEFRRGEITVSAIVMGLGLSFHWESAAERKASINRVRQKVRDGLVARGHDGTHDKCQACLFLARTKDDAERADESRKC